MILKVIFSYAHKNIMEQEMVRLSEVSICFFKSKTFNHVKIHYYPIPLWFCD